MIKAIFLDVDGTLLNDQHEIPEKNITSIKEIKNKGIPICIATGRAPQDLKRYYEELELNTPAICMNGAYIFDFKKNEIIKEEKIPLEEIQKLKKIVDQINEENLNEKKKLSIIYYEGAKWFTNNPSSAVETEIHNVGHGIEVIDFKKMMELWKNEKRNPNKIGVLCNEEENLMKVYHPLKEKLKDSLSIFKSQKNFLEVTTPFVSKRSAIEFVLKNYYPHIKREDLMAIGDSDNDISMLSWVGFGIAMGNAVDSIKEICYDVTLTNQQAGVAEALKKYVIDFL